MFHLFNRYVLILLTKMRTETKTVPSTWYIFNAQGCTHTAFCIYVPYIVSDLHEELANFYRGKRSVAFVTNQSFTFFSGFISHLFGDYAILICENQTIWRLENSNEIRTIVAALLKTKCNGPFVKNKRCQETGKEYFTIVQMILKDEGY